MKITIKMESFKNNSSTPIIVLAGIIAAAFSLMLWASFGDSAIMDELAHIPAGYGYVHNFDYRLNPEHPPLVKALAALPLAFSDLNFQTENPAWAKDINGQWDMGSSFIYGSGNDPNYIVRLSRMAPIFLTLFLIVLIYAWSAELLGAWWGLLPAALFGLSPTILAHGHYVTTDIGAAFGIVLATYYFVKFLSSSSVSHLFMAGISFGVAQLMKFSAVLLIPYFIILIFFFFGSTVFRDWETTQPGMRMKRFSIRAWHYAKSLMIIFAVGYIVVVYPVYLAFTWNYPSAKQTSDTEFILSSFADGPTQPGHICKPARCVADLNINMAKNPITRPFAEYLLGVLMVFQRSSGGNTSYFLGEVSTTGSRTYFPIVYLLKETLPSLIIIFIGLFLALRAIGKNLGKGIGNSVRYFFNNYLGSNFTQFSMLFFVIFYWAYSMKSPLNIGVRHLIPTFPFIYILAAGAWKKWINELPLYEDASLFERVKRILASKIKSLLKRALLCVLLFWFVVGTFLGAPYFLSYFNSFGGGIWGGYRFVTDSNYDWGQDLLRLRNFVESHLEINPDRGRSASNGIDKIAVDYFGGGNPKYYLGAKEVDWSSSKGNPADKNIHWLAVSVNTLQNGIQRTAPSKNRNSEDEYRWLTTGRRAEPGMGGLPKPDFKAGTSIFIYKL